MSIAAASCRLRRRRCRAQVVGLVRMLGEYQALAAEAAWTGTTPGIRALASHPLVFSLPIAEAIYDEMADAHRDFLPERLLR